MKIINTILILISLTSCLSVKRIEKNCDKFSKICITETVTKIEYRDTTIYKDRIVNVTLPNDTVYISMPVYVKDDKCFMEYTKKTFGNIWASAKVDNSILDLKAGYVKNIIQVPIRDTIYLERAITNTTTDNTVTLPAKKYVPKVYKVALWFSILMILAGAGWIFVRIKGSTIKTLLGRINKK